MAKEKKIKVPKQIAGVKVPKKVRKAGNKALALADHPAALELAAAALSAAAAALQAQGRKRRAEDVTPNLARLATSDPGADSDRGNSANAAALKLGDLVKVAALEGARRLLETKAAPNAAAAAEPAPAARAAADKPKRKQANGAPAAPAARER